MEQTSIRLNSCSPAGEQGERSELLENVCISRCRCVQFIPGHWPACVKLPCGKTSLSNTGTVQIKTLCHVSPERSNAFTVRIGQHCNNCPAVPHHLLLSTRWWLINAIFEVRGWDDEGTSFRVILPSSCALECPMSTEGDIGLWPPKA